MSIPSDPELKVQRLRHQISWITGLTASLGATDDPSDVILQILAGVVSPFCLGYSQALFFRFEPASGLLVGDVALGHESAEDYAALSVELQEEMSYVSGEHALPDTANAQDYQRQTLELLARNCHWVTISQRLSTSEETAQSLRSVRLHTECDPAKTPAHLLAGAALWWRAHALNRQAAATCLPNALLQLLPSYFVACPLLSRSGIRGLIIADRRLHSSSPFSREELDELDWYCRQAALALENLEVNRALTQAYNDVKELDHVKSNFLSIISHELRTPLTSMSGFIELLLDGRAGEVTEMQRSLLSRVSRNTSHLSNLVNDLLEVAQIEAEGTIEVTLATVDPLAVLTEALPRLDQRRRQTAVNIHVEYPESGVPLITCDARALGRIFFHLIDNALKFSPEGSLVTVRMMPKGKQLLIEIEDHGVGIPPDALRHIFDYFYQADNSLTRGYEGLGLGLAVTRMLTHATHGSIDVRSSPKLGTIFELGYPIVPMRIMDQAEILARLRDEEATPVPQRVTPASGTDLLPPFCD